MTQETEVVQAASLNEIDTKGTDRQIVSNFHFDINDFSSMKPYEGREKLPAPVYKTKEKPNGEKVSVMVKAGDPRFFVNDRKIIAVWRDVSGVQRRLVRVLFDKKKEHARKSIDRGIREQLRKQRIPGA